jgi:hypothetical protein
VRILAGWFAACAVAWAAVYGIGLAFVNYPRESVAVAVFLVGCAAVFCEWRDERAERALSERGHMAVGELPSPRSLNDRVPRLLVPADRTSAANVPAGRPDPLKAEETGQHRNGGRT